jgi:hypothetical protein
MLCAMDTASQPRLAASFALDNAGISRSSTLAFVPSFYRYALINRAHAARGAFALRAPGASGTDLRSDGAAHHGLTRHVNTRFNKDHELITARPSHAGGSVVEISDGPLVLTRQPGTHARPAAGGGRGRGTRRTERRRAAEVGCPVRQ